MRRQPEDYWVHPTHIQRLAREDVRLCADVWVWSSS